MFNRLSGKNKEKLKILVIDDEEAILELAKKFLEENYDILVMS